MWAIVCLRSGYTSVERRIFLVSFAGQTGLGIIEPSPSGGKILAYSVIFSSLSGHRIGSLRGVFSPPSSSLNHLAFFRPWRFITRSPKANSQIRFYGCIQESRCWSYLCIMFKNYCMNLGKSLCFSMISGNRTSKNYLIEIAIPYL